VYAALREAQEVGMQVEHEYRCALRELREVRERCVALDADLAAEVERRMIAVAESQGAREEVARLQKRLDIIHRHTAGTE